MANELETLAAAKIALEAIGPPVFLSREHIPSLDDDPPGTTPDELFIVDLVSSTGLGMYAKEATTKRVQVTVYVYRSEIPRARTLQLTDVARTALTGAGFRFIQQRPAPDPDEYGEISEYRR